MRLIGARQGAGMADEKKPAQIPKSTPSGVITYFFDGVRIRYLDQGQGGPSLTLQGHPTWSCVWPNIHTSYRRESTSYSAIDLMGFGL